MIFFDLFIKKDPTDLIPKTQDVEIDITDEAGQFKPILVEKDDKTRPKASFDENDLSAGEDSQAPQEASTPSDSEENSEQEKADEPKQTDEETKRRIQELVKLKRQEILAEEMEGTSDPISTSPQSTPPEPKIRNNGYQAKEEYSQASKESVEPKNEAPSQTPRYYKPKPPTQPDHAPLKFFEFKVRIEATAQLTKPQGGLTAEQLSTEAKKLTTDEKLKIIKEMNNYWELKENSRTLDEDERIAIEKAREARHEAHPTFAA